MYKERSRRARTTAQNTQSMSDDIIPSPAEASPDAPYKNRYSPIEAVLWDSRFCSPHARRTRLPAIEVACAPNVATRKSMMPIVEAAET